MSLSVFLTACNPSSGGGGGGKDNGDSGLTGDFKVSNVSAPAKIQKNQSTTITADIEGKDSEIILYQFQSSNGKAHIVPNSGIIATQNKTGQVKLAYSAPNMQGTYFYRLKMMNSDGEEVIKEFDITVED